MRVLNDFIGALYTSSSFAIAILKGQSPSADITFLGNWHLIKSSYGFLNGHETLGASGFGEVVKCP